VEPRRQAGLFALIGLKQGDRRLIGYRALLPLRFDSLPQTLIENGIVVRDGLQIFWKGPSAQTDG
jgi:hypothetical protein